MNETANTDDIAERVRRDELRDLLVTARFQVRFEHTDASGHTATQAGLRQRDVAHLARVSLRYYNAFERGEIHSPGDHLLDSVARALCMDEAQRASLYLLAAGREPAPPGHEAPRRLPKLDQSLVELMRRQGPNPAYITDQTWTLLARNQAVAEWFGDYHDHVPPAERNFVLYMFSSVAAQRIVDIHAERRILVARFRSQYARHPGNPHFAHVISKLLATGEEARALWRRHVLALYPTTHVRTVRHPRHGKVKLDGVLCPLNDQLNLVVFMPPPGLLNPADNTERDVTGPGSAQLVRIDSLPGARRS